MRWRAHSMGAVGARAASHRAPQAPRPPPQRTATRDDGTRGPRYGSPTRRRDGGRYAQRRRRAGINGSGHRGAAEQAAIHPNFPSTKQAAGD